MSEAVQCCWIFSTTGEVSQYVGMEKDVNLLDLNYMSYGHSEIEKCLWDVSYPSAGSREFFVFKRILTHHYLREDQYYR